MRLDQAPEREARRTAIEAGASEESFRPDRRHRYHEVWTIESSPSGHQSGFWPARVEFLACKVWDRDGQRLDEEFEVSLEWEFPAQTVVWRRSQLDTGRLFAPQSEADAR